MFDGLGVGGRDFLQLLHQFGRFREEGAVVGLNFSNLVRQAVGIRQESLVLDVRRQDAVPHCLDVNFRNGAILLVCVLGIGAVQHFQRHRLRKE